MNEKTVNKKAVNKKRSSSKCSKCGAAKASRALHVLRGSKLRLCGECFARSFEERVRKANRVFSLLRRRDKVVVAVSGGKDSGAMLAVLQKIAGEINSRGDRRAQKIELAPVHVNCGIPRYSAACEKTARRLCAKLGVPLRVYGLKKETGFTVAEAARLGSRPPCTYCGVLRKTLFNKIARELEASKIAVGHTCDDYAQTFLMNVMRFDEQRLANAAELEGAAGTAQREGFVRRVRPLAFVLEEESAEYLRERGLPFHAAKCPYSRRAELRGIVENFLNRAERAFPGTKFSVERAALAFAEMLEEKRGNGGSNRRKWRRCVSCGEACSRGECMNCELLRELKQC